MKNIFLYLSAFMPMYFLICIKKIVELIMGNIKLNVLNIIVFAVMLLAIILGIIGLCLEICNERQSSKEVIILSKQNLTDQHFLGYFSLFVLFALTFDLSRLSMFIVFLIILVMIGIVYVKNKLFFINPLLNIFGYNFYNIEYKIVGQEEIQRIKIFYKGDLLDNKKYWIKIKDENFSFVDNIKMDKK